MDPPLLRVLRKEHYHERATGNSREGNPTERFSATAFKTHCLVVTPGVALPATKPCFVEELLPFLAALAILFPVGTAICLLIVVVHEGGRWSGANSTKPSKQWSCHLVA